jgi:hypothetical protein
MSTSDYIPVSKKKYIDKIITLEAENLALKKKLKVYEELLNKKVKKNLKYSVDKPLSEQPVIRDEFKQNISKYLENPSQNADLIDPLISQMIVKRNKTNVSPEFIHDFLMSF